MPIVYKAKKKKISNSPHSTDADNKKEELKQKVLQKLNFSQATASTEDSSSHLLPQIELRFRVSLSQGPVINKISYFFIG